jgi:hypothetical protein
MSESTVTINSSHPSGPGDTQPLKPIKKAPRWRSILISVLGVLVLSHSEYWGYRAASRSAAPAGHCKQLVEQFRAPVDGSSAVQGARQRLRFIIRTIRPGAGGLAKILVADDHAVRTLSSHPRRI